jgi:hypothetical protein
MTDPAVASIRVPVYFRHCGHTVDFWSPGPQDPCGLFADEFCSTDAPVVLWQKCVECRAPRLDPK